MRDGVQDRRLDGRQGRGREGRSGDPRADHAGRGGHARGVHGRRDRRPEQPARPDRGDGVARDDAGGPRLRAAGRDVRLRHRPAVDDPGPGELLDGVPHYAEVPGNLAAELVQKSRVRVEGRRRLPRDPARRGARSNDDGEEEVRADQAARQHRHDRSHRPRQDDADRGDHEVPRPQGRGGVPRLRLDRQRPRGARARDHDRDRPRRVPDRGAPLRPRRLPGPRRLHQEHDHRRRPDGRRDPGRGRDRRPDAPDPRAHPPGPPGRGALHGRLPQQGRRGRRPRAARPRRARGPRAAHEELLPGRRHPGHPRLAPSRPSRPPATPTTRPTTASRS